MATTWIVSCKHKPPTIVPTVDSSALYGNYPDAIGKIFVQKCATAGCHNSKSFTNAAGLRLDTWESLFNGSNSGAVIVPYSPANSSLLFYINPDAKLGTKAQPQMPLNAPGLSVEEYATIKDWVTAGAPDRNGNIPFASNSATRQKIYIANQGCDLISVIDAEKKVVMRYIKVGATNGVEVAHYLKVAPDGYMYASFSAGSIFQKIDTHTDSVVGEVEIGIRSWNAIHISEDGSKVMLGDFSGIGQVVLINTRTMEVEQRYASLNLIYPHGITSNAAFDTFYITGQQGNTIFRLTKNANVKLISVDHEPPAFNAKRNPHEILMAPDRSKYFVTCDASNEVRVMSVKTDSVIDSIPVGIYPQTMAISRKKQYLFVTCTEDKNAQQGFKGSVYVIDYNTHKIIKRIEGPLFQPHGIGIDEQNDLVYIANRNYSPDGPAPHHASSCVGKNGYYVIYDLNTLERLPKRYEISVDPYSSDVRFQ